MGGPTDIRTETDESNRGGTTTTLPRRGGLLLLAVFGLAVLAFAARQGLF